MRKIQNQVFQPSPKTSIYCSCWRKKRCFCKSSNWVWKVVHLPSSTLIGYSYTMGMACAALFSRRLYGGRMGPTQKMAARRLPFHLIFTALWKLFTYIGTQCKIVQNSGSSVGAAVRALAFHQCNPGSIPGLDVICGLSLLVLYSASRGFSPGTPVFPSHQKPTFDLT